MVHSTSAYRMRLAVCSLVGFILTSLVAKATSQSTPVFSISPGNAAVIAGTGFSDYGGDGGAAVAASLRDPGAVAVDSKGNIYIADTDNNVIRMVNTATGVISTIAGTGFPMYSGDGGPATAASLSAPQGLAVDQAGNLFIADTGNSLIRKIDTTGYISTVAGTPGENDGPSTPNNVGDGGAATNAILWHPSAIAIGAGGDLYVADTYNNRIRRIDGSTNQISTVAGDGDQGYSGDGSDAKQATLAAPEGIVVDGAGNLFIADTFNDVVRRVDGQTQTIVTIAGGGSNQGNDTIGDGGLATGAQFSSPIGLAVDPYGNLYVADSFDNLVRRISATSGIISVVAGIDPTRWDASPNGQVPQDSSSLDSPINVVAGIALDSNANLYLADTGNSMIRRVSLDSGSLFFSANGVNDIAVSNIGSGSLALGSRVVLGPDSADFAVSTSTCGTTLDPGATCNIGVSFAATASGIRSATLQLGDSASGFLHSVALSGNGSLSSPLSVSTSSLTFSEGVGTTTTQSVVLNNPGVTSASVSSSAILGDPSFAISANTCGSTLAAGASCQLDVTFASTTAGARSAILQIIDSGTGSPHTVTLSGIVAAPPQLSVSSSSLSFAQTVGTTTTQTILLSNPGTVSVSVSGSAIVGDGGFSLGATTCGSTLAAGASCQLDVTFASTTAGARSAILQIIDSGTGSPHTVTLSGIVTAPPQLSVSSSSLSFTQTVGTTTTQTILLSNPGTVSVSVSGSAIVGDGGFSLGATTCGSTLAAGASCQFDVNFASTTAGARSAILQIADSGTGSALGLYGVGAVIIKHTDFDGDGKADFAVWRPSSGTWFIIPSSLPNAPYSRQWGLPGDVPVAADFDGDGKADFAVWRPSSGTWFIIPSSLPNAPYSRQWGLPGDVPVAADFDGDGKADFAVWRPLSGTWFVIPSSLPNAPYSRQWGLPGDVPVAADFDGDGKADFAVWRPSSGTWFIIPSSLPNAPYSRQWGLPGDVPVAADFDGDGKADFAVWRPLSGTWFIFPSSLPNAPYSRQWGPPGDVPVADDFDGDGKADFAVWRPSSGTWFIFPSSLPNAPYSRQWGLPGDVPQ